MHNPYRGRNKFLLVGGTARPYRGRNKFLLGGGTARPYRGRNKFLLGVGTARQLHVGLPFRCHDRAGTRPRAHAPRKPIQTHTRANAVTRPRNGCT